MDYPKIVERLQVSFPGLMGVYVFGSQASGLANGDSDLDLAVLVEGGIAPLMLWEVAGDIADLVGIPVDLVDLRQASTILQYQILTTGRRLWAKDFNTGVFEAFVLSEKTWLDQARAGLLEDIYREGRVHG